MCLGEGGTRNGVRRKQSLKKKKIYCGPWQFKVGVDSTAKMDLATAEGNLAKGSANRATKGANFTEEKGNVVFLEIHN